MCGWPGLTRQALTLNSIYIPLLYFLALCPGGTATNNSEPPAADEKTDPQKTYLTDTLILLLNDSGIHFSL